MLRTLALIAILLGSGCLQPVTDRLVSSCRGQCPFGECSEECSSEADASCTTPQDCLRAYSCSKSPRASCAAYTAEHFNVGAAATACSQSPGSYCVTTVGSGGVLAMHAVDCTDGGVQSTDCPVDACDDAGPPPASCRNTCGVRYCIR